MSIINMDWTIVSTDTYMDFYCRIQNRYTSRRKNILCCVQYLRTFCKEDKLLDYISYNADHGHYRNKLHQNTITMYSKYKQYSPNQERLLKGLFTKTIYKTCLNFFANTLRDIDYHWSHLAYICNLAYCTHNDLNWQLSETSINIANSIYKEQDWKACPILADSLEDDGVTDYKVLEELKDPLVCKFRGYWLIDRILNKN